VVEILVLSQARVVANPSIPPIHVSNSPESCGFDRDQNRGPQNTICILVHSGGVSGLVCKFCLDTHSQPSCTDPPHTGTSASSDSPC
jgi:hypothetical protein